MDIETMRRTAARTGLGLNYISKDEKISFILSYLWEEFGEDVVLKGGTALNRVHLSRGELSRFSEDIDLDFLAEGTISQKLDRIKQGMTSLKDVMVEGPRMLHRTARFDCFYVNEMGQKDRVMVEFYLSKPPFVERSNLLVKSPFSDAHPTIFSVHSMEDLLAKKVLALCGRVEGKDIYDIFHGIHCKYHQITFRKSLSMNQKFYKKENIHSAARASLKTAMSNVKYIGDSTNHFIPRNLRPNWKEMIRTLAEDLPMLLDED
ncbi:MAG: nucleotidyl transferase AbiEii/AbiGii toxin family protein [Candidatus Thermoplasmatota archaeon]|nr:nucleotidyl transferase AbiEii/AbiGii toxin family protein [Candidatus Thermoplasmatota archaeon]